MRQFFYNLSIRAKMIYTSVLVGVFLLSMGVISYYYINQILTYSDVSQKVDRVLNLTLQLRRAEKDFLLREQTNVRFFVTGDSKYLNRFDVLMDSTQQVLLSIEQAKIIKHLGVYQQVEMIGGHYFTYEENYHNLVERIRIRGYQTYGLYGKVNDSYAELRKKMEGMAMENVLPEIRVLEKDYLLRKDPVTSQDFLTLIDSEISDLKTQEELHLADLLGIYKQNMEMVFEQDKLIGLTPNEGFRGTLREAIHKVEDSANTMAVELRAAMRKKTQKAYFILFSFIGGITFFIILLLLITSSSVIRPIEKLNELINILARGGLPERIATEGKGRIAEMTNGVKMLVDRLRETTKFSLAIGRREFDYEFTPLSEEDDLANALLEMRDNLRQANDQAEQRKIEDDHRNWANQGVALFSDLLRQQTNDLQALGYAVISKLVAYTASTQGGLFMLNDEDPNHPFIEMMGCYAYDRQKYFKKEIEWGEGLIGRCVQEGKNIYMTEIPQGYTTITSGLGDATPSALLIVPLKVNDRVYGAVELASFNRFDRYQIELVEKVGENIASTLSSVKINIRTTELLEKTQQQAEEMAAQEEEMRQNMEELQATQEESERQKEEMQGRLQEAQAEIDYLRQQLGES